MEQREEFTRDTSLEFTCDITFSKLKLESLIVQFESARWNLSFSINIETF